MRTGPDVNNTPKCRNASLSSAPCDPVRDPRDAVVIGINSAGINSAFSATCRDTLTYKTYAECMDTKAFLGWIQREARWHCSSLLAIAAACSPLQQPARRREAGRGEATGRRTQASGTSLGRYRPLAAPETQDSLFQSTDLSTDLERCGMTAPGWKRSSTYGVAMSACEPLGDIRRLSAYLNASIW